MANSLNKHSDGLERILAAQKEMQDHFRQLDDLNNNLQNPNSLASKKKAQEQANYEVDAYLKLKSLILKQWEQLQQQEQARRQQEVDNKQKVEREIQELTNILLLTQEQAYKDSQARLKALHDAEQILGLKLGDLLKEIDHLKEEFAKLSQLEKELKEKTNELWANLIKDFDKLELEDLTFHIEINGQRIEIHFNSNFYDEHSQEILTPFLGRDHIDHKKMHEHIENIALNEKIKQIKFKLPHESDAKIYEEALKIVKSKEMQEQISKTTIHATGIAKNLNQNCQIEVTCYKQAQQIASSTSDKLIDCSKVLDKFAETSNQLSQLIAKLQSPRPEPIKEGLIAKSSKELIHTIHEVKKSTQEARDITKLAKENLAMLDDFSFDDDNDLSNKPIVGTSESKIFAALGAKPSVPAVDSELENNAIQSKKSEPKTHQPKPNVEHKETQAQNYDPDKEAEHRSFKGRK